jgi:hypothetical protein
VFCPVTLSDQKPTFFIPECTEAVPRLQAGEERGEAYEMSFMSSGMGDDTDQLGIASSVTKDLAFLEAPGQG